MSQRDRQLAADLAALDRLDQQPPPPAMVTCGACAHFRPDAINRVAGLGFCPIFRGYNYPAAKRYCREFEEKPSDE